MAKGRGFWSRQFTDADYIERWKARCVINERGCWLWQGFKHHNGYGEASYRGKAWRLHRAVLVITKGPIPDDWDACHTCDEPSCINPEHLFGGSRADNVEDMRRKGRGNHQKQTACKYGHPFDEDNTWVDSRNFRHCRRCGLIRMRLKAGWTREQAESIPTVPAGQRPVNAKWVRERGQLSEEATP